jgi:hypothetical protein
MVNFAGTPCIPLATDHSPLTTSFSQEFPMGTAPIAIRLDNAATGNSADGQIHRNPVDDALAAMSSKLLILLRAEMINVASASIIDSLGNPVTATVGSTKTTNDANFNGHTSLTNSNVNNQYTMNAGGIGISASPQPMTNSFTVLYGLHYPSSSDSVNAIYGDVAATSDGGNITGFYLDGSGNLKYSLGDTTFTTLASGLVSAGSTNVVWVSVDSSTGTLRCGANSGAVAALHTLSQKRTGAGTGTVCYPITYGNSGNSGNTSWHRWALFNKSFMNGAVPGDDAQFGALINTYAAYIGA